MQLQFRANRLLRRFALLVAGSTFILSSCDPTIQQTVENGIIGLSTSFLGSFLQALVQVGAAQA
jgi:hypothetical protein